MAIKINCWSLWRLFSGYVWVLFSLWTLLHALLVTRLGIAITHYERNYVNIIFHYENKEFLISKSFPI